MSTLVFKTDRTQLEGKQGVLPVDKDGYYEILAGAYNVPNNVGETYIFTKRVEALFTKSTMIEKLNKGQLYGEADHPCLNEFRRPGRKETTAISMWITRLGQLKAANFSHHIRKVRFEKLDQTNRGLPVYGVFLELKPCIESMKISLADPNQNTALSVRSFVDRTMKLGEIFCEAKDIITYDYVPNGGIAQATKFNTPGLESSSRDVYLPEEEAIITTDVLSEMSKLEESAAMVGNESDTMINATMIRGLAGWRAVPSLDSLVSRTW